MTLQKAQEYTTRNYTINDADQIGRFDKVLELSYRYNLDCLPANIICAVNPEGDILGVGHLEPHDTWNLINKADISPDFIFKLVLRISLNPQFQFIEGIKEDILNKLICKAREIAERYPGKKIRVFSLLYSDENDEIDFYLTRGFAAFKNILIMKYDLSGAIPDSAQPEGIDVINNKMDTGEELKQYHEAESTAFEGIVWSLNHVKWIKNGPEWSSFSALNGKKLVGNTMTWMITKERSAIEDIFVNPQWRNKGIARHLITTALKDLKSKGKSIATLTVHGDNKPAIALYTSLGFRMFGVLVEIGYDLTNGLIKK